MPEAAAATVILLFLATAIERVVEVGMAALPLRDRDQRRAVALFASLFIACLLCFALQLDFMGLLLGPGLTTMQSRSASAIALAGGSAPAHELLRLLDTLRQHREDGSLRD